MFPHVPKSHGNKNEINYRHSGRMKRWVSPGFAAPRTVWVQGPSMLMETAPVSGGPSHAVLLLL